MEPNDDPEETETRVSPVELRQVAGRYVLGRCIASGAFGVVYEGHYTILGQQRRVAVKLLKKAAKADHSTRIRFQEEVKTLCLLDHPNICKVIDGGIDRGAMYLVMEFAEGGSLKQKMETSPGRRVAPALAIRWLTEAAQGLLAAEKNRTAGGQPAPVYHRDVKPENLLLQQGRVVVADFGAAKLGGDQPAVTSEIVPALWTPQYGSPEQAIGHFVDHRSDIYSLGTTFFQLLTGQLTQARFENVDQRLQVAHDPSQVCDTVPKALGAIVRRMTEPSTEKRYQSFENLLHDLAALQQPKSLKWAVRALTGIVCVGIVVASLLLVGVIPGFGFHDGTPDEREPTLGEDKQRCLAAKQTTDGLMAMDMSLLDPLAFNLKLLQAEVESNVSIVVAMESSRSLEERLRMPTEFKALSDLEPRIKAMSASIQRHREVRDDLLEWERKIESGTSTAQARAGLRGLRDRLVPLVYNQQMSDRIAQLDARVDQQKRQREADVVALQRRLDGDDLEGLDEAANATAETMGKVSEPELAMAARRIAVNARRAALIKADLPTWPPTVVTDGNLLAELDSLPAALKVMAALEQRVDDEQLKPWWRDLEAAKRREWAERVARVYREDAEAVQGSVTKHNLRVKQVLTERQALDGLVEEASRLSERRELLEQKRAMLLDLRDHYGFDDDHLARAVYAALEPLTPLPNSAAADLSTYRQLLSDTSLRIDPAAQALELREPADQLVAATTALRQKVDEVAARAASQEDWEVLIGRRADLQRAKELFELAVSTHQGLAAAAEGLAEQSSILLRQACQPNQATRSFASLEQRRAAVAELVDAEERGRSKRVTDLEEELRGGQVGLATIVREASLAKSELERVGDTAWSERAAQIEVAANSGAEWQASLPSWSATPEAGDAMADLGRFPEALTALAKLQVDEADRLLVQWWSKRRTAIAAQWCAGLAERWSQLRRALEQRVAAEDAVAPDATSMANDERLGELLRATETLRHSLRQVALLEPLAADLLKLESLASPLPALRSAAEREASGPRVPLPEGWPNPAFLAPPGLRSLRLRRDDAESRRLYPEGFLSRVEPMGMRLWFFDKRQVKDPRQDKERPSNPVYMVWCQCADGTQAALVDMHPITFGEMRDQRTFYRTSGYLRKGFDERSHETMAYDTSRDLAAEFAVAVGQGLGAAGSNCFSLPPDDYRDWPGAEPLGELATVLPRIEHYPGVVLPLVDVAANGLAYLHSGLREWTATAAVGVSEMAMPEAQKAFPRRRDTGFRLAVVLRRR